MRFTSDQAIGHALREKMHVYLGVTDHFRASAEHAFMFISKANYGGCFPLAQTDYDQFLQYDSYISCGNLVFYKREFLIAAKMKKVGEISSADLAVLHGHVADNEFMPGWEIGIACNALKAAL